MIPRLAMRNFRKISTKPFSLQSAFENLQKSISQEKNPEEITLPDKTIAQREEILEEKMTAQESQISNLKKEMEEQKQKYEQQLNLLKAKLDNQVPDYFKTQLINAVTNGNLKMMERIFEITGNIEVTDPNGNTLLHIAIIIQRLDFVKNLLEKNPNLLFIQNDLNEIPIELCVKSEVFNENIFIVLFEKMGSVYFDQQQFDKLFDNASPSAKKCLANQSLWDAVRANNDQEITQQILNAYLLYAAQHASQEDLKMALKNGADLNAVDAQKQTALHKLVAATNNREMINFLLQELIKAKCDIYAKDVNGHTAMDFAHDLKGQVQKKNGSLIETEYYLPTKFGIYKSQYKHNNKKVDTNNNINEIVETSQKFVI